MKYVSLETLEVHADEQNPKEKYAFKIVGDSKTYHLKAKT